MFYNSAVLLHTLPVTARSDEFVGDSDLTRVMSITQANAAAAGGGGDGEVATSAWSAKSTSAIDSAIRRLEAGDESFRCLYFLPNQSLPADRWMQLCDLLGRSPHLEELYASGHFVDEVGALVSRASPALPFLSLQLQVPCAGQMCSNTF